MDSPRIDELLDAGDSRYALVIIAAKRARQINNYYHSLGELGIDEFPPPLVNSRSRTYSPSRSRRSPRARSSYTAPSERRVSSGDERGRRRPQRPRRRHRRHRHLQGGRAGARLVKDGFAPLVVTTEAAQRFVMPLTFAAVSRRRCSTTERLAGRRRVVPAHRGGARGRDVMVVAPATANTIAKMAAGLADNLLTAIYLAFRGPVIVAPP